jgi:hypothetical protein
MSNNNSMEKAGGNNFASRLLSKAISDRKKPEEKKTNDANAAARSVAQAEVKVLVTSSK